MPDHLGAHEVESRYVRAMGSELGKVYFRLWNECTWLHWKWAEFVTLFGTKATRVELLNKAAGGFFRIVQDCLWENVLLHICRLTDPPRSKGKDNLTLQRLPNMVSPSLRPEVQQLLAVVLTKSDFARDWRNRQISHQDLRLALREPATALAFASRRMVKEVLASIAALLNAVEAHYCNATVAYDVVSGPGNAEAMLHVLRNGLDAESERWKRIRSGNTLPGDRKPRPAV